MVAAAEALVSSLACCILINKKKLDGYDDLNFTWDKCCHLTLCSQLMKLGPSCHLKIRHILDHEFANIVILSLIHRYSKKIRVLPGVLLTDNCFIMASHFLYGLIGSKF